MPSAHALPSADAAAVAMPTRPVHCPDGMLDLLVVDAPLPQTRGGMESAVDKYSREQVRHLSHTPISAKKVQ